MFNLLPLAISLGSQIVGGAMQSAAANKQAKAIRASADSSLKGQLADLSARAQQEREAAQFEAQNQREMSLAEMGLATASAADSNVAGASVDAAKAALTRRAAIAGDVTTTNFDSVLGQLNRNARGAFAERDSRINGAPQGASATSQAISGLGFAAQLAIPFIKS